MNIERVNLRDLFLAVALVGAGCALTKGVWSLNARFDFSYWLQYSVVWGMIGLAGAAFGTSLAILLGMRRWNRFAYALVGTILFPIGMLIFAILAGIESSH